MNIITRCGCNRFQHKKPSIKKVRIKSRKIDTPPPLSAKCPHWLNSLPPPCPCGHTINFEKIDFLRQKVKTSISEEPPLSAKCPHLPNLFLPDCGRPLWTALAQYQMQGFFKGQLWLVEILIYCKKFGNFFLDTMQKLSPENSLPLPRTP